TFRRLTIGADGSYNIGTGSAARDTTIARASTGGVLLTNTGTTSQLMLQARSSSQSADIFQNLDNSSNIMSGFSGTGQLYLGRASALSGNIKIYNSGGSGSTTIDSNSPGSTNYTLHLPAENGPLCSTGSICSGY